VVIAPERAKRPSDFVTAASVRTDSKLDCAFCEGGLAYKERLHGFENDEIYVIPNKFPAFVEDEKSLSARTTPDEGNFYTRKPSLGGHDVIVVKDHDLDLPHFNHRVWVEMFLMFQRRYDHFRKTVNALASVGIYNHLSPAGASIQHPHAQLMASNVIPNFIEKELHGAERWFETSGRCVFCALIEHELKEHVRVIYKSSLWVAFTFYAARFPFEIWVLPLDHHSRFEDAARADIDSLATCFTDVFQKLNTVLRNPPLNFYIHSIPNDITHADYYHWHIEITPRLSTYGGYELGSGMVIDVVSPEKAAEFLRAKK
jgi:UDPglucose--hexose-1-phosphate uridylyltransferase